jgi:RNA polymerase sigma-70 factor (ECF subfamily)
MAESESVFPITSQTLIHRIQNGDAPERQLSLAKFCTLYYPAIYGFARMRGLSVEDAQDRTQDFFVEVVRDSLLVRFDPARGSRLSSWLMTCFKNLDINQRAKASTQKRGGNHEFVSFDTDFAERCHHIANTAHLTEESAQDLALAMSLWRSSEMRLRARYLGTSNEDLVRELLPLILPLRWPDAPALTQEQMAIKHGTTAVRLKAFFNRTLRAQAERFFTEEAALANPGITKDEIGELWQMLRYHADGAA